MNSIVIKVLDFTFTPPVTTLIKWYLYLNLNSLQPVAYDLGLMAIQVQKTSLLQLTNNLSD